MHRAALGTGARSDEWAEVRLPRHAGRSDFVFLVARERDTLVGFGYGYRGEAGQWWSERVAAALDGEQRAAWLELPHFELVELHVQPGRQRRGTGSLLLGELLARQPYDRALLTTRTESRQARRFYAKNRWIELAPVNFGTGYQPYLVLGRYLPETDET